MDYQVTLLCKTGQYKPVSAIVSSEVAIDTKDKVSRKSVVERGITKICIQRGWGNAELKKYNYTLIKIREYNKEKIEREKKERYERIKEEKYASGEWKRPKGTP